MGSYHTPFCWLSHFGPRILQPYEQVQPSVVRSQISAARCLRGTGVSQLAWLPLPPVAGAATVGGLARSSDRLKLGSVCVRRYLNLGTPDQARCGQRSFILHTCHKPTGHGCSTKSLIAPQESLAYMSILHFVPISLTDLDVAHLKESKYQLHKVSGAKKPFRVWFLEPEASNIGGLGPSIRLPAMGYHIKASESMWGFPKIRGPCLEPLHSGGCYIGFWFRAAGL